VVHAPHTLETRRLGAACAVDERIEAHAHLGLEQVELDGHGDRPALSADSGQRACLAGAARPDVAEATKLATATDELDRLLEFVRS